MNREEEIKQIASIAWKGAANAFRMYPDNKHTFVDYWNGAKDQFSEYLSAPPQSGGNDEVLAAIEKAWDYNSRSIPEDTYDIEQEYARVAGKNLMFKEDFESAAKELLADYARTQAIAFGEWIDENDYAFIGWKHWSSTKDPDKIIAKSISELYDLFLEWQSKQ